jgi:hypothetical protein
MLGSTKILSLCWVEVIWERRNYRNPQDLPPIRLQILNVCCEERVMKHFPYKASGRRRTNFWVSGQIYKYYWIQVSMLQDKSIGLSMLSLLFGGFIWVVFFLKILSRLALCEYVRFLENVPQLKYMWAVADHVLILEEIKRKLNSSSVCYHSVQKRLSSQL